MLSPSIEALMTLWRRRQSIADLGDERREGELDAALFVFGAPRLANLVDLAVVDLEDRVHMRRRAPAEHHVLGDPLAHHGHRHDFGRPVRPGATGAVRCAGATGAPRVRRVRRCAVPAAVEIAEDVLLGDASGDAGAGDLPQVDAVLLGDAADQWRRFFLARRDRRLACGRWQSAPTRGAAARRGRARRRRRGEPSACDVGARRASRPAGAERRAGGVSGSSPLARCAPPAALPQPRRSSRRRC